MNKVAEQEPFSLSQTEAARQEALEEWDEIRRSILTLTVAEHRLNVHRDLTRELNRMPDG